MSKDDYNAGYFAELASQVTKSLRRDDAHKKAIIAANRDIFYAFDATALGEMSAHEVAAETLKKRGVRLNPGEDGVRALEFFNQGLDWGRGAARFGGTVGTFAADARDLPPGSVLDKFFRELEEE
jgi:hypothetical protein